jgi:hypothetical protein
MSIFVDYELTGPSLLFGKVKGKGKVVPYLTKHHAMKMYCKFQVYYMICNEMFLQEEHSQQCLDLGFIVYKIKIKIILK